MFIFMKVISNQIEYTYLSMLFLRGIEELVLEIFEYKMSFI